MTRSCLPSISLLVGLHIQPGDMGRTLPSIPYYGTIPTIHNKIEVSTSTCPARIPPHRVCEKSGGIGGSGLERERKIERKIER
ncbi:uncharacterized protein BO72DRAFT_35892 [Aspergillus fijiensis CBS 313.89]|uniref:Uncharacterized protein n=1 Tax=Aspergillus fijiensis CBS 313.89 TaxID=1448319 RepID=A0A8G1W1J4_9EURO|nr:uncharacterized protein BO72DRAFT_35892 [Aspergillus fijiensis CBS 313.89]RAK79758.1 hypothetical protein BO72DRAFT_35892 [Aspergillus fijiensis CBS 313.89]